MLLPVGIQVLDELNGLFKITGGALLKELHAINEGMIYDD